MLAQAHGTIRLVAALIALALCALVTSAPASAGETAPGAPSSAAPAEPAVLAVVQRMLDAWREADRAKLDAVLHADFREVTMHYIDGAWSSAVVTRERLVELMDKIDKGAWDDRLVQSEVRVDGPIGMVWARYRFTVHYEEGGERRSADHCGVEMFQLYRTEGGWKVVNFADTHSDDCA